MGNPMTEANENIKTMPSSAFLIVNSQVFPLEREIVNIGRKLDNHVVIQDSRISRNHAQLRVMNGQFVLLDLNSTGGTFVNDQRITKSVLYSGDTISLAGVLIKFVQDAPRMMTKAMDRTGPLAKLQFEDPPTQAESTDKKK
ncbi:MAG: FHA domain-containing protein [Anaerolineae bacterium]|nr:MAG: FHA domain-containing protein [Anaerolineae bacterium]